MILLVSVAAGLIATLIRSWYLRRSLTFPSLRYEWLVVAAVLPQILAFQFPAVGSRLSNDLSSDILVGSQAALFVFAWANLTVPGLGRMGLGLLMNFVVIVLNGGWMPMSTETLQRLVPNLPDGIVEPGMRLVLTKDAILQPATIWLEELCDRFILPGWIPYKVAFSLGDVLIALGAFYLLWSLSSLPQEK